MGKTRLEAFSDGVLAIIITIMVLELKIPESPKLEALKPVLPIFLTYALSFVYIGIYWNNHHHLMHLVKHVSAGIMWANLNLLFWLSLIPFVTGWMDENHFEPIPVALYAMVLAISGVAYTILQITIDKCHKSEGALKEIMTAQRKKGIISLVIYIGAILFAFINTIVSGCLLVGAAVMWIIPDKKIERLTTAESE